MKSVNELSKRQKELLLEVWNTAHRARDKSRQSFKYKVGNSDKSVWEELIRDGYIESIPDTDDYFILTSDTDGIFAELVAAEVKY